MIDSTRVRALVMRHRLPFAIAGIIGIALLMTAISLSLYITSGTASLDLSRPGYSQVRDQLVNQPSESFSESGELDKKSVETFEKLFDSQRATLNKLGDFDDASLDDTSLQLQAR